MFHLKDNLFFGRTSDGSVRIRKFSQTPKEFPRVDDKELADVLDVVIDEHGWASIISTVSVGGEADGGYYRALEFHNKKGKP